MKEGKSLRENIVQNKKQLFFLSLLILIVYANALNNEFVSDDKVILITDFNNTSEIFSQPALFLRALPYFIINLFFGKNPFFFRLLNIGCHILAVSSIYLIVNLLRNRREALAVSTLYAVHPIIIESVTWISGGGYAQYGAFFLLSFLFYILSRENKKYYYFSLVVFLMSLLSAEKSFVLSAMFLVYQLSFENIRKEWKKLVPYLVLGSAWGFYYLNKLGERADLLQDGLYSQVSTKGIPLKHALEHIATALTKYLELIFWPEHLTLYQSEVYATPLLLAISFMVLAGLAFALIYSFFKNKYVFWGLSLFLISLSPFLTPFGISWWVAERYAYLGTFGIIFLVVLLFGYLEKKYVKFKNIIIALFMIAAILLSVRTISRNNDWQNEDNLWVATAKESPSDPKTHNNLGDYYGRHGNQQKAAQEFLKAIELNPFYGDAYHNLANTYQTMGKIDLAIENYKKAVEFKPGLWQSYQNLAIIYFNRQDFETAGQYQEKAVEININDARLHFGLGVIYQRNNQQEKANLEFQKAFELDPKLKESLPAP